jgi:hypothetical protein
VQPLLQIVITLIIFGLIWWLIDTQLPLPAPIKTIIRVVCVLALIIWLAGMAGYPVWIR